MILEWLVFLTAVAAMGGAAEIPDPAGDLPIAAQDIGAQPVYQVRIQQRVIIRVPRRASNRTQLSATNDTRRTSEAMRPPSYVEKKMKQCVAADQIVGMTPSRSRALDFLTKDNKRVRAYLDGGCLAMDFHGGMYMERAKDGKLCAERDVLMARSGMRCEIDRFRRIELDDDR